jgi:hypothetical protein
MLWALFAIGAVAGALASASPADAARPCWETVIDDWADNTRVDGRYPIDCYREALAKLPEDMRAYSSAPEDIERAMREEMRRLEQERSEAEEQSSGGDTGSGPVTTDDGGSSGPAKPPKKSAQEEVDPAPAIGEPDADDERTESDGVFARALDEIGPDDANSFPLPLLVLGGLVGVLLLAGAISFFARRHRPSNVGR